MVRVRSGNYAACPVLDIGNHDAIAVLRQPVTAANGMVVTSQRDATEVGVRILRQGGNAVDAAVAV